jgi:hypothetical protein
LRVIQGGQERPTDRSDALDDYVDDEVFGIPPNLISGFLTGLLGASAGAISLIVFFHVREPYHYVSLEWLIFVALGGAIGFFLRIEWSLVRAIRHCEAGNRRQAMRVKSRGPINDPA